MTRTSILFDICVVEEQEITTKQRLLLLDGDDLKELGFLMGPRKQILQWIRNENLKLTPSCSTPLHTSTPSTSTSVDSSPATTPVRPTSPIQSTSLAGTRLRKFQVNVKEMTHCHCSVTLMLMYCVTYFYSGIVLINFQHSVLYHACLTEGNKLNAICPTTWWSYRI